MKLKGFTLIEIVLYIGLASLVFLSISSLFSTLLQSNLKSRAISEAESNAVQIIQQITQTVRNATGINSPGTGSSAPALSVSVPTGSLSPTVFDLSAGTIRMQEGVNPISNLSSNVVTVSALSFKNLSGNSVQFSFIISRNNPEGRAELNYTQTYNGAATIR